MQGGERFISYAQNLEDVMLWRALRDVEPGFYIDVGAAGPTLLSVTRAFYERGWHGINVEPVPEEAAQLAQARARDVVVQAALSDRAGRAALHRVRRDGQTGLSTLDGAAAAAHAAEGAQVDAVEVEVTTLAALCAKHVTGPVHFLKIDVEGAEAAVLAGADFRTVRPWIVVVEATAPLSEEGSEAGWETTLLAAGYRFVWFDGLNRFYLAAEHGELARHFTVQPNVFDGYSVYDAAAHERIISAEVLALHRAQALEQLRQEVARLTAAAAAAAPAAAAGPTPAELRAEPSGWKRRMALRAWRLVRPVLRPLAWRARTFLVGDVRRELFELAVRLDSLAVRQPPPEGAGIGRLGLALERLMLTLALEQGRHDGGTQSLPKRGGGG